MELQLSRVFKDYRGTLFDIFSFSCHLFYNLITLLGKIKVWSCYLILLFLQESICGRRQRAENELSRASAGKKTSEKFSLFCSFFPDAI